MLLATLIQIYVVIEIGTQEMKRFNLNYGPKFTGLWLGCPRTTVEYYSSSFRFHFLRPSYQLEHKEAKAKPNKQGICA